MIVCYYDPTFLNISILNSSLALIQSGGDK